MKKVVIVGAGIVGAATAYELARNGINVTLTDRHAEGLVILFRHKPSFVRCVDV